jgi:hypothetical protein
MNALSKPYPNKQNCGRNVRLSHLPVRADTT